TSRNGHAARGRCGGMKTNRRCKLRFLFCLPPLLMTAGDALAWGLYTHVWFAQSLLWLVPLADPRFRAAARKLPALVMAGACLPDLALVRGIARSGQFGDSHEWELAAMQIEKAGSDEARALALGYASHLLTDIFAHNHFVPAHENVWADIPVATHASCEWALDHHVRPQLFATPGALLEREQGTIRCYLQKHSAPRPPRRSPSFRPWRAQTSCCVSANYPRLPMLPAVRPTGACCAASITISTIRCAACRRSTA